MPEIRTQLVLPCYKAFYLGFCLVQVSALELLAYYQASRHRFP